MSRLIAIGDLHGHYKELTFLLDQIKPKKEDTLVFLGDYVDGGPDTKKVVSKLIELENMHPHWQFLYGNHEDLILDALVYNQKIYGSYDLWWMQGGKETYNSYVPSDLTDYEKAVSQVKDHIPVEHLAWLQARPKWYETDKFFFVHAGLVPEKTIEENKDPDYHKYMIWIRDEFLFSDYNWGKKVIFGHTVFPYRGLGQYECPLVQDNKIGIDGMHHNEGVLIAYDCTNNHFWFQSSVN